MKFAFFVSSHHILLIYKVYSRQKYNIDNPLAELNQRIVNSTNG